jgi:signal transduction histidine kinase
VDATDLIQILLNLTINAFQSSATPQTVQVTAARVKEPLPQPFKVPPETELVVGESAFAGKLPLLALTISDQGSGIGSETLARIFDPYFTTKTDTGTGLGLAIVARLVQTHRGLIHVKTRIGLGTQVTLYFPLKT